MKFDYIPSADETTVRVIPLDGDEIQEGDVLDIQESRGRPGSIEVFFDKKTVVCKPTNSSKFDGFCQLLAAHRSLLAVTESPAADGSINLRVKFFTDLVCDQTSGIEIAIDEESVNAFSRALQFNKSKGIALDGLHEELLERCTFEHSGQCYFFYTAGRALDRFINEIGTVDHQVEDKDETSKLKSTSVDQEEINTHMSLGMTGDGVRFVATNIPNTNVFSATRITNKPGRNDRAVRIAKGRVVFKKLTDATGELNTLFVSEIDRLNKAGDLYLQEWRKYNELELEALMERARNFGAIKIKTVQQMRDGDVGYVSVKSQGGEDFEKIARVVKDGYTDVELVHAIPEYIATDAEELIDFEKALTEKQPSSKNQPIGIRGINRGNRTIELEVESLPSHGYLVLSLRGDQAQIDRRNKAKERVDSARSANPQLIALISDGGKVTWRPRSQKTQALSNFVTQKVFKYPPTSQQRRAIEVALNTPDIAVIQGPPGTGKTTVIQAIIERINEIQDKQSVNTRGSILLTAYQHDAVDNMTSRMEINGLPIPKFGRKSNRLQSTHYDEHIQNWCEKITDSVRTRHPELDEREREVSLKKRWQNYIFSPSRTAGISLLSEIIAQKRITEKTREFANKLLKIEKVHEASSRDLNQFLVRDLKKIRTTPAGHTDDGSRIIGQILHHYQDELTEHEQTVLREAISCDENEIEGYLSKIQAVKEQMLDRYLSPPHFRVAKSNDDIVEIGERAFLEIRKSVKSSKDRVLGHLAHFVDTLEVDALRIKEAIADYSTVFAATCQQSVNKSVISNKIGFDDPHQELTYEYVIVDEAARVTPGDLLVPLSQGKKIILVGDHRQLPHIVDQSIVRKLENDQETSDIDQLKTSMFEYLFSTRLKQLEEDDGIPRRVTLDKQFRMHPSLGEFVSKNFYEIESTSEKFTSGLTKDYFTHNLQGTNGSPFMWIDVPQIRGQAKRKSTSMVRAAECEAICQAFETWSDDPKFSEMNFGIISFYRAQSDEIQQAFNNRNLIQENIKIGTVDSFQGMEFDVIMLSICRTATPNWKTSGDLLKDQRRLFGHLCLPNRLNVAMSRQKKLLAVVGDAALFSTEQSRSAVPSLHNFLDMCKSEGSYYK